VALRGWWVELPERAESYLARAARERGLLACAGRAQAELYLLQPRGVEREAAKLAAGSAEHRLLAEALLAQDLVRRGDAAAALPRLLALEKHKGEVGAWAALRAAEVLARLGRLAEARARLADSGRREHEPPLLRPLVEARLAQREGRVQEADHLLADAAGEASRAVPPLVAAYHRARAILLSLAQDAPRALMHHRLAVDRLKELGDRFLLAKEYLSLGQSYVEGGELDIGEYFFQRARELVEALGNERLAGLLASRLGLLALARGDLAAARAHFERDLELAAAAGLRHAAAHARRNVGRVRVLLGDRSGLALLEKTRADFLALGDRANAFAAELDELSARLPADAAATAARLPEIDRFFEEAGRPEMRAHAAVVRAELLAAEGKPELAKAELEEAARVFHTFRRADWSLQAALTVARRLEVAGAAPAALEILRRAHREALEAGAAGVAAVLVGRIGGISERAVLELGGEAAEERARPEVPRGPWYQESLERSRSAAVRALLEEARDVAATEETVLILGETGTGKELLARLIHESSRRRDATFLAVNCGGIPEGLLESELFGHARGAFTGAERRRLGLFEAADGGCAFLDEIGELSPRGQVTLLRFLEDRKVRPVGSNVSRAVDVRILAATNRDLLEEARAGRFRLDLYFRLSVFPLSVPPLRERLEDLELLTRTLLTHVRGAQEKGIRGLSPESLQALRGHDWPGNLRELDNVLRAAAIRARGPRLVPRDLVLPLRSAPVREKDFPTLEALERRHISQAMALTGGNQLKAARLLGIHRNTLAARLARLGE